MKNTRQLERTVRAFSNHRRIQMLGLLGKTPGLSVVEIAGELNMNFKTASEHLRRLFGVGLIGKRSRATAVEHRLTPLGKAILKFLRTLE